MIAQTWSSPRPRTVCTIATASPFVRSHPAEERTDHDPDLVRRRRDVDLRVSWVLAPSRQLDAFERHRPRRARDLCCVARASQDARRRRHHQRVDRGGSSASLRRSAGSRATARGTAAAARALDAITSQGLEVYALLNDELAPEHAPTSDAFEDRYVAFAKAVVDHYKDRIRVWETINEPNDWAGGSSARIPAATFARVHGRLYAEVKVAHPGDACWDVKLVTGPLFSFDGSSSASYLDQAIAAGRAGGPWKSVRSAIGKDPIDDVGYHVYVAQGTDSSEADVAASANANLDEVASVLAKYGIGEKRIWVSEIGYQASLLGDDGQATRLDTTFAALSARGDVASIQWFTIGDFVARAGACSATAVSARSSDGRSMRGSSPRRGRMQPSSRPGSWSLPKQVEVGAKVVADVLRPGR